MVLVSIPTLSATCFWSSQIFFEFLSRLVLVVARGLLYSSYTLQGVYKKYTLQGTNRQYTLQGILGQTHQLIVDN
jgi:hypothetical protein